MAGEHLTGSFRVRATRAALGDVRRLFPHARDQMIVRRHALALRYWPARRPTSDAGQVLDLDWSWIQALSGQHVGELRVADRIGTHDNLRIIFYVGDQEVREPLPMIWVLHVVQKKRDDFSSATLATIRARRTIVLERFYGQG